MLKRGDFMESFFVALNAVLPMFIMLFIGFLVRKLKILQDSFLPQLNKIVFNVFFRFWCSITSTAQIFQAFSARSCLPLRLLECSRFTFCQSGLHSLLKSQITAVVRWFRRFTAVILSLWDFLLRRIFSARISLAWQPCLLLLLFRFTICLPSSRLKFSEGKR